MVVVVVVVVVVVGGGGGEVVGVVVDVGREAEAHCCCDMGFLFVFDFGVSFVASILVAS